MHYRTSEISNSLTDQQRNDLLSVSSLNRLARSLLEGHFPAVLVEGEISNMAMPRSGHWYLTLKDENSQIRCAMFRNRNLRVGFRPENGMQVIVKGKLSIYEGRGDYQLIAEGMDDAGAGALQRAFEQLKAKLSTAGLFDEQRKKEVLDTYSHIAVITSPTGAAIRDILAVFKRRFPAIRISVLPVTVQGSSAPAEIIEAIAIANRNKDSLSIDAIILGRGGGSLEDLQAFNEESVARAIAGSELPLISAVGHEIDFTIADFVADLRAPTPSAAAEMLSPDQEEYAELFYGYEQQFLSIIKQKVNQSSQQLQWLMKQLKHPGRRLQEHAQTLDVLEGRLLRATLNRLASKIALVRQQQMVLLANSPTNTIEQFKLKRQNLSQRFTQIIKQLIKNKRNELIQLSKNLDAISPLATLGRGYSITYSENDEVLRHIDDVEVGSKIVSKLNLGRIVSTVDSVHDIDEPNPQ